MRNKKRCKQIRRLFAYNEFTHPVKDVLLTTLTRHFILLRVEWAHIWPTQDVVIYRKLSGRDDPEQEELEFLKANFMTMDINEMLEAVPGM